MRLKHLPIVLLIILVGCAQLRTTRATNGLLSVTVAPSGVITVDRYQPDRVGSNVVISAFGLETDIHDQGSNRWTGAVAPETVTNAPNIEKGAVVTVIIEEDLNGDVKTKTYTLTVQ